MTSEFNGPKKCDHCTHTAVCGFKLRYEDAFRKMAFAWGEVECDFLNFCGVECTHFEMRKSSQIR